jgi:hypothetical protein
MRLVTKLKQFAEERRKARQRLRTYLMIRRLPEQIRKDIGWPAEDRARNGHPRG